MNQENIESRYQPNRQFHLKDYFRILLSRKWVIISIFVLVMVGSIIYVQVIPPVYQAQAVMMKEKKDNYAATVMDLYVVRNDESLRSQERLIANSSSVEEIKDRIRKNYGLEFTTFQIIRKFSFSTPKEEPSIIEVLAKSETAERASALANTIADVYIEKTKEIEQTEVNQGVLFLQQQMQLVDDKLRKSEQELNEFREKEGISVNTKDISNVLLDELGSMQKDVSQIEMDIELAKAQLQVIQDLISEKKKSPALSSIVSTPQLDAIQNKLMELEVLLAEQLDTLTDSHPDVIATKQKIAALRERLNSELESLFSKYEKNGLDPISELQSLVQQSIDMNVQIKGLERKAALINTRISKFKAEHPEMVSKQVQLIQLERYARMYEQSYMMLLEKYEEMRLVMQMKTPGIKLLDKAPIPNAPIAPKKMRTMLNGFILALFLSIGMAFFLEYLDDSIKRKEDVERFLGLPVMGTIPAFESFKVPEEVLDMRENLALTEHKENGDNQDPPSNLNGTDRRVSSKHRKGYRKRLRKLLGHCIIYSEHRSPVLEGYRTLGTNIMYANVDSPIKSLLVTSAAPSEGKTISASNLAITLAQMGKKVLLVDADLRRPRLHRIFLQDRTPGLADFLIKKKEEQLFLNDFIRSTKIENLFLLTCGSYLSNPGLLLSSESMQNLMEELKPQYDMVIFDSPPVASAADSITLSTKLDATLLVVKSGKTKREMAKQAIEFIENVDADVIGVLLNNIDYSKQYGSYYYYYYYYRHYYYSSKDEEE
jgi:succinoglycan biosynthesis transport protein ExoP